MNEEFLYFIWRLQLYQPDLQTTDGDDILVEAAGILNQHAGPDFSNARIRIGNTLWAGNIEIHVNASDWYKHHHDKDINYQNVILHVVYLADTEIINDKGEEIPCLELKGRFSELLLVKWKHLLKSRKWIPCDGQLELIPDAFLKTYLERLLVERFESKVEEIDVHLRATNNNWEASFFRALAKNFGFHVNAAPFEVLARTFDFKLVQKYSDSMDQLEALLFGQAGLLNENLLDDYNQRLLKEYSYLQHKHQLQPMMGQTWKFMRMRPVNFPSIRIAQLAALYHKKNHLFGELMECKSVPGLQRIIDVSASEYWDTHYTFGSLSKAKKKNFGKSSFELILINTLTPFMFVYGRQHLDEELKDRALNFLYQTSAESNSIIKKWEQSGIKPEHAGHSQALLQLKKHYCSYTKCLNCQIGNYLISSNYDED